MAKKKSKKKKTKKKKFNRKQVFTSIFSFWFVGIIGLMFFFLGTHQVSGESMEPTFQDQDRIVVLKQVLPKRNDIITFEPADAPGESYVKRIVGLPGDHLLMRGETLYLVPKDEKMPEVPATVWEPTNLPESTMKILVQSNVAQTLANYKNIPDGHYFVEGDNRDHSTDSRSFGWVLEEQIEGIVKFRYYPFSNMGPVS